MLRLKGFRDEIKGLSDLLNFACLPAPGTLLSKDGAASAFYIYRGKDIDSSSPEELAALSARINAALAKLGTGWMLKTDVIRRSVALYPMPEGHFTDPVSRKIDEERRKLFESSGVQYESIHILALTYMPPLAIEARFYKFLVDEPEKAKEEDLATKHLAYFEKCLSQIELDLSSVLIMKRLMNEEVIDESGKTVIYDEVLQYLNYCVTGKDHPIRLPACPMYIDSILGYQDFFGGLRPKIGTKQINVLAINGFPQEGEPAILKALSQLKCEYRWNTRFIFMDSSEARSELEGFRKRWKQKVRGFRDQIFQTANGRVDEHAVMKVSEVDSALALVESGVVGFGYYTSVIILLNEDQSEAKEAIDAIKKTIEGIGFSCREETVNAVEAWLGSLPSHSIENVRRPVLHTLNLADLLPMTTIWSGERFNPHPKWPKYSPPIFQAFTDGSTAFRGNIHVSDIGHYLVIGPTGGGKSLFLNFLDAQYLRYAGSRIFAFDKKYSKFALCMGVGGRHFDIASDENQMRLCPLAHINESESERSWAKEWIANLCRYQGLAIQSQHKTAIHEAIEKLAKAHSKSLTDFNATVQDHDIRNVVAQFTLDGSIHILDGTSDMIEFSRVQMIEMENLMALKDHNALPILEYLFHKVEKSLDGSPVLLSIDEAWIALQHPAFRDKIRQWLKEMRSKNVSVGLATQSLSDAAKSGIMEDISESCPTKIFTANADATNEESRKFYKKIGLSDRQIEIIAGLTPKRQYYIVQPHGQRVIDLGVGPYALKWMGAGDTNTIIHLKELISKYPDNWIKIWENEK
jgi:type IV secretion system protein VirB4